MPPSVTPRGLFVGISVADSIWAIEGFPQRNTKILVNQWELLAGGPVTNAAVAFHALGGDPTLLTVLGKHPLSDVIRLDLAKQNINVHDMAPDYDGPPSFASVLVSSPGGDRTAVAAGAAHLPQPYDSGDIIETAQPQVLLIDGYLPALAYDAAEKARAAGIPVVIDCGSWRASFEQLLPLCDVAICSEDFSPPGISGTEAVLEYLTELNIPYRAVTHGERPIVYRSPDGDGVIRVEAAEAVDTLGAGDIYHGAFAYEWATGPHDFPAALAAAARTARLSCLHFGTRDWIAHL